MKNKKWQVEKVLEDICMVRTVIEKNGIAVIKTFGDLFGYSLVDEKIIWTYEYEENNWGGAEDMHEYNGIFLFIRKGKNKRNRTIYTALDIDGKELWSFSYEYEPNGYKYFIGIENGYIYMKVSSSITDYNHIAKLSFKDGNIEIINKKVSPNSAIIYNGIIYAGYNEGLYYFDKTKRKKLNFSDEEILNVFIYEESLIFIALTKYIRKDKICIYSIFKVPLKGNSTAVKKVADFNMDGSEIRFENSIQLLNDRIILFSGRGKGIYSVNIENGKEWVADINEFTGDEMILIESRLFVLSQKNNLGNTVIYELDFNTGYLIGTIGANEIPELCDSCISPFPNNQFITSNFDSCIWKKF